ncbi:tRNA 2-thiouridine(34) synthase MnmA [bacterium]|nr:tRNA 2-thiouridine(34) synthase MnmA [bacterium]
MRKPDILVAMSGGVDSSVAALLLKEAGHSVVGMTATLFGDTSAAGPCCGVEGGASAHAVCEHLGIPHHQVDLTELFERRVIDRFIAEYEAGRTPNPCADCNRFIKFDTFFELAGQYGCDLVATGHHARISAGDGPARLLTGRDPAKDQSYFLAGIDPGRLEHIRFPIGELEKTAVRRLAAEAGLPTATRSESQDVCFLPAGTGLRELLAWHTGQAPVPGPIVDEAGHRLGEHPGIEFFTIGQRQGLRLGGGSEGLVVHRLEPDTHTVVVAHQTAHSIAAVRLGSFTNLAPDLWRPGERVLVRARYRQELWEATVELAANWYVARPIGAQFSLAPGQWLVGYRGEVVLFGGLITGLEYR